MSDEAAGFDERAADDVTHDVLRELREDAQTTDLVLQVVTRGGVVHLRGEVPTLGDAENAKAVAARVAWGQGGAGGLVVASLRETRWE